MNYGEIKICDIANGIGVRISLFVSGCTHHCKNCFNPETWSFDFGSEFTHDVESYIIDELSPDYISGLSILGGEPFEVANQRALAPFIERVRKKYPQKTIWMYSGYTYEELIGRDAPNCEVTEGILKNIDVLVDGRFIEEQKDISLKFRGSKNQRIIDVKKTLDKKRIVLLNI